MQPQQSKDKHHHYPYSTKVNKCWFWAGASSETVQTVNLLRAGLLFHGHESHHRDTSCSHCIQLQIPSIARNNYGGLH